MVRLTKLGSANRGKAGKIRNISSKIGNIFFMLPPLLGKYYLSYYNK
jgi:hypothetical protein